MIHPYLWITIVGGFVTFLVACTNGANDLSNAFGTSYGSRVLTLLQIIIIATGCEFAGAVGLGSNVASTMSSGIASTAVFKDDPYVLMYGFLCALGSTFIWVLLATWKNLPVSTHHAIAGGIIGFALVYGGGSAVIWAGHKDTFPFVSGVVPIIISWFISPLLSGIVAVIIYCLVRFLILQPKNAVKNAPYTLPVVVTITVFLEFFFIFLIAGSSKLGWTDAHAAWVAAAIGGGCGVASIGAIPLLKMRIRTMERKAQQRCEESGISLHEAMREILSGGRSLRKPDSKAVAPVDGEEADLAGDALMPLSRKHGNNSRLAPLDSANLLGAVGSPAVVSLPASPVSGGPPHPSQGVQAAGKMLDGADEADGAVVRDEEDDDEYSSSDAHRHGHSHGSTSSSGAHATFPSFPSGNASSHNRNNNNNNSNNNSNEHDNGTFEEEVFGNPRGSADGAKKSKKDRKTNYVFVDGLRLASNGGMYDANDARIFDPRAEYMFRYLQIFTAACTSVSHGANDVSNSIGSFAAIYDIYNYMEVRPQADIPVWALCLGGAGIVVGLATYGVNLMRLLGEKIALVTPSRGFSAEFATALVVSFASMYGIPISSTHCITGAVIAINMVDVGFLNIKWMMVLRLYVGWIATLVISAIISATFFSQGINSPMPKRFVDTL